MGDTFICIVHVCRLSNHAIVLLPACIEHADEPSSLRDTEQPQKMAHISLLFV
jgi:hypothetical protein